jgi:hypothetical protein
VGSVYFIKNIEDSSSKISDDKKNLNVLNTKNDQAGNFKVRYGEIKKETDEVFQVVVDKDKTVDFIKELEMVAAENKVKLKMQVVPDVPDKKDDNSFVSSVSFSVTAAGSFENIMHFLANCENLKYYADLSDPKMSFGDFDEYNKDLVILNLNVKLYQK